MSNTNVLRRIEFEEEYVIVKDTTYHSKAHEEFLAVFNRMKEEGKILGNYEDSVWHCNNSINERNIDFIFDEVAYQNHPLCKEYGFSVSTMRDMMKSYALYCVNEYIFNTIRRRISTIKEFIDEYKTRKLIIDTWQKYVIGEFLYFINLSEEDIDRLTIWISVTPIPKSGQRQLAPMINYLVLDNEISEMYASDITDEEFVKWFPVYFFVKVGFVLPIRGTELTLTPLKCVDRRNGEIYLRVRRSLLKKHKRYVYYEPEKDYQIFEYRMPDTSVIKAIEKYQRLTNRIKRKYLFVRTNSMHSYLTLQAFNSLVANFIDEWLIGNPKYSYALFASGIQRFEHVTLGDARPIAMSNLFYQNVSADLCRQLADHERLSTSGGYFTNVTETILASSIMNMQREIHQCYKVMEADMTVHSEIKQEPSETHSKCASLYRTFDTGNITDCIKEGHLEDCLGCRFFCPTESELNQELDKRKKKLESEGLKAILCLKEGAEKDTDIDKILLDIQTAMARYKTATDESAKEKKIKWQRYQDSMMT